MQQHLGRLDGVAKAEVSLASGKAVIYPKSDGTIDPVLILKATYDSGVTVAEMTMTASGRLVKDSQKGLVFQVAPNQSFEVEPNELAKRIEVLAGVDNTLTLRGRLYKKPAGKRQKAVAGPLRFEALEIVKKE